MYKETQEKKGGWLASIREIVVLLAIVFLIRTFVFGLYQVPSGSMETTMLVGERFFADKLTYLFRAPERSEVISLNDPTFKYSKGTLKNLFQQYVWFPNGPQNWTKRIIGIPGDHVKGVIEEGKPVVYLNEKKLDEPYVNKYPLIVLKYGLMPRSYDPKFAFEDQPFYRINPLTVERFNGKPVLIEPGTTRQNGTSRPPSSGNYWNPASPDEFDVKLGENEYWLMGDNRLGSKDCRYFGPVNAKKNFIHGRILFRIWSHDSDESWWIVDMLRHPIDFWKRMRWSRFFQIIR